MKLNNKSTENNPNQDIRSLIVPRSGKSNSTGLSNDRFEPSENLVEAFTKKTLPGSQNLLQKFSDYLGICSDNTRKAYITDVTLCLTIKFFHHWDYPKEFNNLASTLVILQILDQAQKKLEQNLITQTDANNVLRFATEQQKKLTKNHRHSLLSDKELDLRLQELLGPDFKFRSGDDRLVMQLRKNPAKRDYKEFSKVRLEDRLMIDYMAGCFHSDLNQTFWQETFKPASIREILAFQNSAGNSENTIARKMSSLVRFEDFLFEENLCTTSTMRRLKRPKIREKVQLSLHKDQSDTLFKEAKKACKIAELTGTQTQIFKATRDRAMLMILDCTAIRATALCKLREKDVDLINKTVLAREKGGKEKLLLLNDKALSSIIEYLSHRQDYIDQSPAKKDVSLGLFITTRNKTMNYRSLSRIVNEHAKKSGISEEIGDGKVLGAHAMRRSAAMHMHEAGAPIERIQEFLNHSSIQTTKKYLRGCTSQVKDTVENFHPRWK